MSATHTLCGGLTIGLLCCVTCVGADRAQRDSPGAPAVADGRPGDALAADVPGGTALRLREGMLLESEVGTFALAGERIQFTLENQGRVLPVLENLALERVASLLDQHLDSPWLVTGVVTEYRGRNYLLLQRAVVRSAVADPVRPTAPEPRS